MEYLQYIVLTRLLKDLQLYVLNLIINGIPSIPKENLDQLAGMLPGFKPYYKWNTFNTPADVSLLSPVASFKPYYKWNTFNT